ncbi:MAG: hypothetical protein V7L13_30400, partial [Nostoc sp.]
AIASTLTSPIMFTNYTSKPLTYFLTTQIGLLYLFHLSQSNRGVNFSLNKRVVNCIMANSL